MDLLTSLKTQSLVPTDYLDDRPNNLLTVFTVAGLMV